MKFQKGHKINLGEKHSEEWKKQMSEKMKSEYAIGLRKNIFTSETRKKMSEAHKGRKPTKETLQKMSASHLGHFVSEETKEKIRIANLHKKHSDETKQKLREINLGKKQSKETIEKRSLKMKKEKHWNWKGGKPKCIECGIALSSYKCNRCSIHRGVTFSKEKNHLWKGGITPLNKLIRSSKEYVFWRKSIFERDNYTCIWCKQKGGELHADHIKPFALFPELRFAIDNGRTLCVECHKKTDTFGYNAIKKYAF